MKLPAHPVKTGQARQGLPGHAAMITGSAFLPAYLPVNEGRQPGTHEILVCGLLCRGPTFLNEQQNILGSAEGAH